MTISGSSATIQNAIRDAYRWILDREPDSIGLRDYCTAVADGVITLADVRTILMGSPEFRGERETLIFVDVGGVQVAVDPQEREFGQTIAHHGAWEPHVIALIRENLPLGGVFVDVGANLGVMSMNAADAVGPGGKVIAIEPNPKNADQFLRGVLVNGFDNVVLHQIAASDSYGVIFTTRASNGKFTPTSDPMQIDNPTQTMPLDDVLAREDRIDLIKLDIEGYEPLALRGLTRTLDRCKPRVLCEFNPISLIGNDPTWPEALIDTLFGLTSTMIAMASDGVRTPVHSASELHALWRDYDARSTREGWLPEGWVHFDLLCQVE